MITFTLGIAVWITLGVIGYLAFIAKQPKLFGKASMTSKAIIFILSLMFAPFMFLAALE